MGRNDNTPYQVPLARDYSDALVASGLVDDVAEPEKLTPRPYRYAEGEFICRHGDPVSCLWIIVNGSVAVKDGEKTIFVRRQNEVVGEQHLVGNGYRRIYDLVAAETSVEVLSIDREDIEAHPEATAIWRNIARIISLKLRHASKKASSLSRQLAEDTRILHAYTNAYALGRRLQGPSGQQAEYQVERAILWFSDVVNFTGLIDVLAPDRIADLVQRFFNAQSLPILSRGGHIDKFMGDGMMAFWVLKRDVVSTPQCDEAIRAAEEALEAVGGISVGKVPLSLRVGLHVGLVVSGDFGSATRHQFTLIGREVNKAARLEQVREDNIVVGDAPLGNIRLSSEFRNELSQIVKHRYSRNFLADVRGLDRLSLFTS